MRHLIDELMTGKIIGETMQPVQPVKVKAAQVIVDLSQRLEQETEARIKAENISGYTLEDARAAYAEVLNEEYKLAFN